MKKRLLFSLMAMCTFVAGYALNQGEYVYTPQGRFLITGQNINANSAFNDFSGWTLVSAMDGKTLETQFNVNANGYAEGINSVASTDATDTEGMYYKFEPTSASDTYVVSYKMKGLAATSIRVKTVAVKTNLVAINGVVKDSNGNDSVAVVVNTAEELSEDWQTFSYAIVGDGSVGTYHISFTGLAPEIQIADLQIAPAVQYADLRQRDAMLEKLNAYKNCYAWDETLLADYGYTETIANLQAIGDESGQAELDEQLTTAKEVLSEFLKANMDDFLAGGSNLDYLPNNVGKQGSKVSKYGIWNCLPAGRGHWDNNAYPDMGHFQSANNWNNGSPTTPMGMYTQIEGMTTGSYVFTIEGAAALREPKKNDWNNDDGLKPAYGVAYIVKIVDGAATDTIASVTKDLTCNAVYLTPFILSAKIESAGTYEFGLKSYCKEAYQSLKQGSVSYFGNAGIWAKTDSKYSKAQLTYEENVRTQITAGRNGLTTAAEYLADEAMPWGKTTLKASVDEFTPKIEAYEAMSQDDIIATWQEDYKSSTTEETGYLEYEVYQNATKYILAANNTFKAVNDSLNSIQLAIDNAETTLNQRLYDAATGKEDLKAAIAAAKEIQAQMKAVDYSQDNVAAIVVANDALNVAVELFKQTVPAEAIATIVDIDFEADAVQDAETQLYSITGTAGTMEFSNFALDVSDAISYQQGIWSNGEQMYKGYVRVGNGTGTVNFDPTNAGDMGTNILKINCDLFLQGLAGRFVGFYLKNETDSILSGFYANYYDNKIDATSTLPVDLGSLKYGSGGSYANRPPQGAEGAEGTVLAKNSFEVVIDYGEGSIYCTTTSDNGVVTTAKQVYDKSIPRSFVLQSNYNNNDRRIWFDNLKIQRITAGATEPFDPSGITEFNAEKEYKAPTKVIENGRIIINGKYDVNGIQIRK